MISQDLLHSIRPPENVVLVAEGADQGWLSTFSGAAKSLDQSLSLVALHHYEEIVHVNCLLSDLDEDRLPELLIIPQGEVCMKHLLVDPRVHDLINNTVDKGGWVAFGAGAELVLSQIPLRYRLTHDHVCLQRNQKTAEFAHELLASKAV